MESRWIKYWQHQTYEPPRGMQAWELCPPAPSRHNKKLHRRIQDCVKSPIIIENTSVTVQNTSKYIKIHQNDKTPIWSTATLRVAKFHTSSDLVFRSGRKKLSWYGELGRACRSGLCKSDQFCFVKKLLQGDLVSFLVIQSQSNGVLNMRRNTQPKATLWYP